MGRVQSQEIKRELKHKLKSESSCKVEDDYLDDVDQIVEKYELDKEDLVER